MKEELQVENGHFTRIVNPLLENLIKVPFKGCELSIAIFIIRKTYGFNKTQDELSISQIMEGIGRSRQTVVTGLKNLQLVNILRLVKKGNAKGVSNIWTINKYYNTWTLVNMARLVKRNDKPSLVGRLNLVKTARHTKETKETKDNSDVPSQEIVSVIDSFKEVNQSAGKWYGNTTQRDAIKRLITTHSLERVLKVIKLLKQTNLIPYMPSIATPVQLEDKWSQLETALIRKKNEIQIKNDKNKVAFT